MGLLCELTFLCVSVVLPDVSYAAETCSLTLREDYKLYFNNKLFRKLAFLYI